MKSYLDLYTLMTYTQQLERRLDEKFNSLAEATRISAEAADTRFSSMNEFRGAMADQAATMMPRSEVNASMAVIETKLDALNSPQTMLYIGFGSILAALLSGLWLVGSLKIDASTTPAMIGMKTNEAAIVQHDQRIEKIELFIRDASLANRERFGTQTAAITRLNVWMDFVHDKVFPDTPRPPEKQP